MEYRMRPASDYGSFSGAMTASAVSLRAAEPYSAPSTPPPMGSDAGNVKVVVRCRAFVPREREAGRACIIRMDPATQKTLLLAPIDLNPSTTRRAYDDKEFTFDKSFWSHDESDPHYVHQEDVYRSFGEEFLDHNFEGYNTCIFAYGQTGSGKSYTMMGNQDQPGLIPRTCEELFERIERDPTPNTNYHVHVSYFEVYNEHVRDLLVPRTNPPAYLKIRESLKDGVYVQGLTEAEVRNYGDVKRLMECGDLSRTTAATKMNDTSSRSHAVFTIQLKQIQHSLLSDATIERCARMRLVDLAGSERANKTEAVGARLKEGGNINKSLTTLGRVIAALAKKGRTREIVPFRDSVLTYLLKDSLVGNSKTAMVACISPTDYDETLSTLRYADQAKRIRITASVNEDRVSGAERDARIREMEEQIRSLQISVKAATERRREEANELDEYQRQVALMARLNEERSQVSDAKMRALAAELEELRPLREENEALRQMVRLTTQELKNPIVIPPHLARKVSVREGEMPVGVLGDGGGDGDGDEEREGSPEFESGSEEGDDGGDEEDEEWDSDETAADLQADVQEFLKDLGMFRRRGEDDRIRFTGQVGMKV
ncbi:kinesin [Polyplosphaeria fusca]|uniref:Kinesin-like protein n=1 Tax=Polyplosphaeria fusca TaxID=682080 RepID=A0A9P4QXE6_9PLEO|nr:kinesin [Polyplosphaeria fusca]